MFSGLSPFKRDALDIPTGMSWRSSKEKGVALGDIGEVTILREHNDEESFYEFHLDQEMYRVISLSGLYELLSARAMMPACPASFIILQ